MLKLTVNGLPSIIDENKIMAVSKDEYYDKHKLTIMTINGYGQSMEFKTEEEMITALDSIIKAIEVRKVVYDVDAQQIDNDYIKGFKEGVEYALKLKKE